VGGINHFTKMILRLLMHAAVLAVFYAFTGPGALAYGAALIVRRWLVVPLVYAAIWITAQVGAPVLGKVPVPCFGETLRMQSVFYCAAMRNFVSPDLLDVADDAAQRVAERFPGTVTLALDGNLPVDLPLIPHLSHNDGEKLDFAFYYADLSGTYLPGKTRSPVGYFAFEGAGETCPPAGLSLRWDMGLLQELWPDRPLDTARTREVIEVLGADPRVSKIFVEPPLAARLGVSGGKVRFQGCRAARHDDHIHVQL
jgi:hypothetical protein